MMTSVTYVRKYKCTCGHKWEKRLMFNISSSILKCKKCGKKQECIDTEEIIKALPEYKK